jgi:hypothetical protein
MDDRLHRCSRIVRKGVLVGAAEDRDVSRLEQARRRVTVHHGPGTSTRERDNGQWRLVGDPH